jgi:hypothetical protein
MSSAVQGISHLCYVELGSGLYLAFHTHVETMAQPKGHGERHGYRRMVIRSREEALAELGTGSATRCLCRKGQRDFERFGLGMAREKLSRDQRRHAGREARVQHDDIARPRSFPR